MRFDCAHRERPKPFIRLLALVLVPGLLANSVSAYGRVGVSATSQKHTYADTPLRRNAGTASFFAAQALANPGIAGFTGDRVAHELRTLETAALRLESGFQRLTIRQMLEILLQKPVGHRVSTCGLMEGGIRYERRDVVSTLAALKSLGIVVPIPDESRKRPGLTRPIECALSDRVLSRRHNPDYCRGLLDIGAWSNHSLTTDSTRAAARTALTILDRDYPPAAAADQQKRLTWPEAVLGHDGQPETGYPGSTLLIDAKLFQADDLDEALRPARVLLVEGRAMEIQGYDQLATFIQTCASKLPVQKGLLDRRHRNDPAARYAVFFDRQHLEISALPADQFMTRVTFGWNHGHWGAIHVPQGQEARAKKLQEYILRSLEAQRASPADLPAVFDVELRHVSHDVWEEVDIWTTGPAGEEHPVLVLHERLWILSDILILEKINFGVHHLLRREEHKNNSLSDRQADREAYEGLIRMVGIAHLAKGHRFMRHVSEFSRAVIECFRSLLIAEGDPLRTLPIEQQLALMYGLSPGEEFRHPSMYHVPGTDVTRMDYLFESFDDEKLASPNLPVYSIETMTLVKHQRLHFPEIPPPAASTRRLGRRHLFALLAGGVVGAGRVLQAQDPQEPIPPLEKFDEKSMLEAVARRPQVAFDYFSRYAREPWARSIIEKAAKAEPRLALYNMKLYMDSLPDAEGIVREAVAACAISEPYAILDHILDLNRWPWAASYIVQAAIDDPYDAVQRMWMIKNPLRQFDHPVLTTLQEIADFTSPRQTRNFQLLLGARPEAIGWLVDAIHGKRMTLEKAWQAFRRKTPFIKELIDIVLRPDHLGRFGTDQGLLSEALDFAVEINSLHRASSSERFAALAPFSAVELYVLMMASQQEMFPSTFDGYFARMLQRRPRLLNKPISGVQLLVLVGWWRFREFVQLATERNGLEAFVSTLNQAEKRAFFHRFIAEIEWAADPLGAVVAIAETLAILRKMSMVAEIMDVMKAAAATAINRESRRLYEILMPFGTDKSEEEAWIRHREAEFGLDHLSRLESQDVFAPDNVCVQRHFFYEDRGRETDSATSFQSFRSHYAGDSRWEWIDRGAYVLVRSKGRGPAIWIYANKPQAGEKGDIAIEAELTRLRQVPTVAVHRGHAFPEYLKATIARLTPAIRFVYLGSCGGYKDQRAVLDKAPHAQLLVTKGQGTMLVNDPLLRHINEILLLGRGVDWSRLWRTLPPLITRDSRFRSYVRPDLNITVLMIKAYRSLPALNGFLHNGFPRYAGLMAAA